MLQSIQSILPVMLLSVAAVLGSMAVVQLSIRSRKKGDDEWRDPPPIIYRIFKPLVRLFAADVKGTLSEAKYTKVQVKLSAAGMNYAILPEEFVTLKIVFGLVCVAISALLYEVGTQLGGEVRLFLVVLGPLGYLYPEIWLKDRTLKRRRRVAKEFPFLLDLLVLSMKAGLNYSTSLGQAINSLPNGPVKDEFGKLLREVRAGKIRRDALLGLAARMNINSVHNFVAAINQAEETGSEIVEVLTIQAEQRRSERFIEAEAAANKAPVKMLIPMVLFLFPIVFLLVGFIMIVKLAESNLLPEFLLKLLVS